MSKPRLSITWLAPKVGEASGGFRNIVRFCTYLGRFGHTVRLHVGPSRGFRHSRHVSDFLTARFWPPTYEVFLGYDAVAPCDALVVTYWKTAYVAYGHRACKAKFYFVQDFEPSFYPMGTDHLLAENTYRMGFFHVTSGPWCASLLRERYGARADHVRFPIDRSAYFPRRVLRGNKQQVLFFARPDMPRRCFELGIAALGLFHHQSPEVEIALFGSSQVHRARLPFPHRNVGLLPTLAALAQLYAQSDVGLVLSATNPSLVSFEMMACGCPVVDLDLPANAMTYGSRENAWLVDPSPQGICEGLCLMLEDHALRERIAQNGLAFSRTLPTEEEAAKRLEDILLGELRKEIGI